MLQNTEFDNLYLVSKKELKKVCKVLANAFSEDPIVKKAELKYKELVQMYGIIIRLCKRYGKVYATSEKFEGVIGFTLDKYANMRMWHIIRSGAFLPALKMMRKLGKMMRDMSDIFEEDKKNLNIGPYIYLGVIGVSQEFQGKGFGGKMLRALIHKADNEGKSLYLETETEENVRLYEKFGFYIHKKVIMPDPINLPMWEMVRKRI